jgi:hypothetical protein
MRPGSTRLPLIYTTSKLPAKSPLEESYCRTIPALYSYRRISTGRSRAAARAGIIVATTEMPIATIVIHKPSKTLGWKGT